MIILMSTELITIIIVCVLCGVLVIVGLYLLIEKFFLTKRRCKRTILALERKYEYLHSLLLGQDAQYIQRLELISRTNLLYGDIHSQYFRRFKEIRDNQDELFVEILNELKELLSEKKFKEFKNYYHDNEEILISFEDSINGLDRDLYQLIKPEEEARQKVLQAKESFREVKSKFNQKESELSYVYDSFMKVFETIDERFTTYDNYVETALYEEASNLLPSIYKVLEVLTSMINVVPNYISEVNEILPNEIKEIKTEYNRLLKESYPLSSFNFEESISNIEYRISSIREKLKSLQVNTIGNELNDIHNEINDIKQSFLDEIASKEEFDQKYTTVNEEFLELEKEFIKISNNMIRFKKIYILDEEHLKDFDNLKTTLNDVSKDKRRLEIYVHSVSKTPYKVLLEKMKDLDNGNQTLKAKINSYLNYLKSLKSDCENVHTLIETQYFKAKEYTRLIKNLDNEYINSAYLKNFDKIFVFLDDIDNILQTIPIDVKKMNQIVTGLSTFTNSFYQNLEDLLANEFNARKLILIANKDRAKYSDVNALLTQAEQLYFGGDFKKSTELALEAINKVSLKDGVKS